MVLPVVRVTLCGVEVSALIDTGCEQSVIRQDVCCKVGCVPRGTRFVVEMLNGESTDCLGEATVALDVNGTIVVVKTLVVADLVCDCEMIIGIDVIKRLGGVLVDPNLAVRFGRSCACVAAGVVAPERMKIADKDFTATFDGTKWTIEWKWEEGKEPELVNRCSSYRIQPESREDFDNEIQQWIRDGWLKNHDPAVHGQERGVIPLMAVWQPHKQRKTRPVMDYRELNCYVSSHPGREVAVCQEKLRVWRRRDHRACLLDLRKAYLQVHVSERLQKFQTVRYRGKTYVMTRMGFGLNVAPKIMTKIISNVLALDDEIARGTDHYLDDIWVDESLVNVVKVKAHLSKYGLESKDPVPLDGARVLGLRVSASKQGRYLWRRDGELPEVEEKVTKRQLFSVCGKLTGHYPVAGWLRTACSYVKRLTNDVGWDDEVPERPFLLAREILDSAERKDPVGGVWRVPADGKSEIWCDASNLAVGCCLTVDGEVIEDASWIRREDDGVHINVSELEAVVKGLSLVLKWGIFNVEVVTDSSSVYNWVKSILEDRHRPKVSGLSEMIIKRRLGLIAQQIEEYNMNVTVRLVPSAANIADALTRIPRSWVQKRVAVAIRNTMHDVERIREIHNSHHLGINRTWYIARKYMSSAVTREMVARVVDDCNICRQVDPSPISWEHGKLSVQEVWGRVAADITYVNKQIYLSVIDCGPSRFAIWRKIANESTDMVLRNLRQIFLERSAPGEILTDNGPCFTSNQAKQFFDGWGVIQIFSCAFKHSGNGIIERNHRTIKRMTARSGGKVEEMVFWYNNTPNSEGVVPADSVYGYESRLPGEPIARTASRSSGLNPYRVGDAVYKKPGLARCMTPWREGVVTGIIADNVVEVDGTNRHISDVRRASEVAKRTIKHNDGQIIAGRRREMDFDEIDQQGGASEGEESDQPPADESTGDTQEHSDEEPIAQSDETDDRISHDNPRPTRDRKPPAWLANFYVE